MKRKPRTLQQSLELLERTNHSVRRASKAYDRMVAEILAKPICTAEKPCAICAGGGGNCRGHS